MVPRMMEPACGDVMTDEGLLCHASAMMSRLMITCPNTGKLVPTRFTMEASAMKAALLDGNEFECTECGKDHEWTIADAVSESRKLI